MSFQKTAIDDGAFGKLRHRRAMASIDKQDLVRMNRDTLYSSGVFGLEAAPAAGTARTLTPQVKSVLRCDGL